jgi:hypothetical protein
MTKSVCLQIPIKGSVLIEIWPEGGDEGVTTIAGSLSDRDCPLLIQKICT